MGDADLLGALDGDGVERALPGQPGQGADRPVDRLRPPTQIGYDPDAPEAAGEVGKVGVPVAHLGHMRQLLDGIPVETMNTSMTINATAAWLLGLYIANAEDRGVDPAVLRAPPRTTS